MRGQGKQGTANARKFAIAERLLNEAPVQTMPSPADNELLSEVYSWGPADIASSLRRCEERLIYEVTGSLPEQQRNDALYLRKLAEWLDRAAGQQHLRGQARVIKLNVAS